MKMIIEGLVCHFPWVTHLNFKRDFMEIMLQCPPPKLHFFSFASQNAQNTWCSTCNVGPHHFYLAVTVPVSYLYIAK